MLAGFVSRISSTIRQNLKASSSYRKASGYKREGDYASAERVLRQLVESLPYSSRAHIELGKLLIERARFQQAADAFRKAVELAPGSAEAYRLLGVAYRRAGAPRKAEAALQQALRLAPDSPMSHCETGLLLAEQQRYPEAQEHIDRARSLAPALAEPFYYLGLLLLERGENAQAVEQLERALEKRPDFPAADCKLGNACYNLGELGRAMQHYGQVLKNVAASSEDRLEAHVVSGNLLAEDGRYDEALQHYEAALPLDPNPENIRFTMALALLAQGRLEEGWEAFDAGVVARVPGARWSSRELPYPRWEGGPLSGRTILVSAEGGIGDEIRYSSCLPDAIRSAKRVVVECDPRLEKLLARSFPELTVIGARNEEGTGWLAEVEPVDVQAPIGSLPRYFRRRLEDFPVSGAYLRADPEQVAHWRSRLESLGNGLKVGVAWRSGDMSGQRRRYFPELGQWGSIFSAADVQFVNLQYDECSDELQSIKQRWGVELHQWEDLDRFNDIEGLAAMMSALDLVITTPTVVSVLAAAVGAPVWMISVRTHEVFLGTDYCPWFPQMRLFRQHRRGEWEPVMDAVAAALRQAVDASAGDT